MIFREALVVDIAQMHEVRMSVKENVLSSPELVKPEDYGKYLKEKGRGWLCETEGVMAGFGIVDLQEHNVWALFVRPEYERQGIGRRLHDMMLDWYFTQTEHTIWLSTDPNSRAEKFYKSAGWKEAGFYGRVEIKLELGHHAWKQRFLL